jgi:hypothetical protein
MSAGTAVVRGSDSLPDRPPISAPPRLEPPNLREADQGAVARQPALGLAGLLFVVPVAVLLGVGAGSLQASLRVLGPLSTFALPVVAMIAFWWEDWPGARLKAPLSGLLNTVLVIAGGVVLTLIGQLVVGKGTIRGVFDATPGPHSSPTFPATMPLAGAFFVVMLQLTLVNEGWPLRRLGRIASAPVAVLASWAIALTLYLLLIRTLPEPGSGLYFRGGGPLSGAAFGAMLTAIGLWQVLFYVALRGWPFAQVASRGVRLSLANLTVIGAGVVTYVVLHSAIGLAPPKASAVAGAALTAALLRGMLFEGLRRSGDSHARQRMIMVGTVAVVGAALYAALTAIAHQARWTTATSEEWVTYAGLNAIGLGVILHVGIGRRWPFARAEDYALRDSSTAGCCECHAPTGGAT